MPAQQRGTFRDCLSKNLLEARDELTSRWLERISARVSMEPGLMFPTDQLLDHVPLLIEGIAAYMANPEESLGDDIPVVAKAMELGALRHAQGFDAHQILKEYELLGSILFNFMSDAADEIEEPCERSEMLACFHRAMHAVELIRQATTNHYLRLSAERVNEREERLRRFNRMVAHELKNRVSAIRGAASLLGEDWPKEEERARFVLMISENALGLQHVLENLHALSRLDTDSRQQRNVLLPEATAEAVRQLREMAQARNVDVTIAGDLPAVEVNAAAVELALVNYVSNAIKYADRSKPNRFVRISADLNPRGADGSGAELTVRVTDNGIGIAPGARANLFQHFYRVKDATVTGTEGTGLGLSLVRETVESFGGRAWAEFPEEGGCVFAFTLPSRREADAAAAGVTRTDEARRVEARQDE